MNYFNRLLKRAATTCALVVMTLSAVTGVHAGVACETSALAGNLVNNDPLVDDFRTVGFVDINGDSGLKCLRESGFNDFGQVAFIARFDDVLLGDINQSGCVNFQDISLFILVLASGDFQAEADIDENGVVDFSDIALFIAILQG